MISTSIPVRSRTASTNALLFRAMRKPAVPTDAVVTTASRAASSAMSAIASTVRAMGSSFSSPLRSSPSPSRVTSARSTTVRHSPSSRRSPITNLTELVPTSTTAKRPSAEELLQALRDVDVRPEVEPELAHRRGHERRILGLDGDRPQNAPVRAQLGKLGHRAADGYVPAPLVHVDREQLGSSGRRSRRGAARACTRLARARARRASAASTDWTSAAASGKPAFSTGFHCSSPSSSTRWSRFRSIRPPRTLTDSLLATESRYRSSLSSSSSGVSSPRRVSASPKLSPKARHSHRGDPRARRLSSRS